MQFTKSPLLKLPSTSVIPTDKRLLPLLSKASLAPSSITIVPATEPKEEIHSFLDGRVDFSEI